MWQFPSTDFTQIRSTLYGILLVVVALVSAGLSHYITSKAYQKTLSDVSVQLGQTTSQLIEKQETLNELAEQAKKVKEVQQEGLKLAEKLEIRYQNRDRVVIRYRDMPLAEGETDCSRAKALAEAYFKELRNEIR